MNDMAAFVQNSSMEDKIEFAMCLLAQMSIRDLMDRNNCGMTDAVADFMELNCCVFTRV